VRRAGPELEQDRIDQVGEARDDRFAGACLKSLGGPAWFIPCGTVP
jgi:hypothetical protein